MAMSTRIGVKPIGEMVELLKAVYLPNGAAVLLMSGPGQGKTASMLALALELQAQDPQFGCCFFNMANSESIDLRGLPRPSLAAETDISVSQYGVPAWMQPVALPGGQVLRGAFQDLKKGIVYPRGLCIFDECRQVSDESVLLPLAQHMDEGRVGSWAIPAGEGGWLRVYLSNRMEDMAGVQRLHAHTWNRFAKWEVALDYKSVAPYWESIGMRYEFMAFAAVEPQTVFTGAVPAEEGPYCTPRSWHRAHDDAMRWVRSRGLDPEEDDLPTQDPTFGAILAARVGEAATLRFLDFCEHMAERPTFQDILSDPTGAHIPVHGGAAMAVVEMLVQRLKMDDLPKVALYVGRLPKAMIGIFCQRAMQRLGASMMRNKTFAKLTEQGGAAARIAGFLT